jgi:transcriptional regulator with XRE-family HTH domain
MNLGEIIHNYRLENKMTLEDVANKCGITKGYVAMLEKNINPKTNRALMPSLETILKVSQGLSIDIDTMFDLLDDDIRIALNHKSLKAVYGNVYNNQNITQTSNNGGISNSIGSDDISSFNNNSNTTNNYYNKCTPCEDSASTSAGVSQNKDSFFAIMDNLRKMNDNQLVEVLHYTEFVLSRK